MRMLEAMLDERLGGLLESLCVDYIETKCYQSIMSIHTGLGRVESALTTATHIHHSLLSDLKRSVTSAVKVIEDLLLAAMEDQDVATMRQRGLFLYQIRK